MKFVRSFILLLFILIFSNIAYAQLEQYPDLFMKEGQFNAKIIVGKDAAPADLEIATEIAKSIQTRLTPPTPQMPDLGKSVKLIETNSNTLNYLEPLGRVIPMLTSEDLYILKDGEFSTKTGRVSYNQYLQLRDTSSSLNNSEYIIGITTLAENEQNQANLYLLFPEDVIMFEYIISFSEGVESKIDGAKLSDLEGEVINMLGRPTYIYDSEIDTNTNSLKLHFVNALVDDMLEQGEKKTYDVLGKAYEIELLSVHNELTTAKAKFRINGEITDSMEEEDKDILQDGLEIIIKEILGQEAGEAPNDMVAFVIGSGDTFELEDTNYTDSSFEEKVYVSSDHIDNAEVRFRGYKTGDDFILQEMKYRLRANARDSGHVYVPPGGILSDQLFEPEGLFGFDFLFAGPTKYTTAGINFHEKNDNSYHLSFTTNQDLAYTIPLADNSNDDGNGFKYGTEEDMLWFTEGTIGAIAANYNFTIEKKDYFILTNSPITEVSDTRVLQYKTIDTNSKTIIFRDLAFGNITVNYYNSTKAGVEGEGEIRFRGGGYLFYISNATNQNIAVDQNNDGDINNDKIQIVTKYGGTLDLGADNFPDDTSGLDSFRVNLTTPIASFSANGLLNLGVNEVSIFNISEENDNEINIDVAQMSTIPGDMIEVDELEIKIGGQIYGALFKLTDHGEGAEELFIDYPDVHAGAKVVLGPPHDLKRLSEVLLTSLQETAVAPTILRDNQISKQDDLLIVIGGPCVNSIAEEFLDPEENCAQGFEPGKASIRYLERNKKKIILVAGYEAEDTQGAGKVFANFSSDLRGKELIITNEEKENLIE